MSSEYLDLRLNTCGQSEGGGLRAAAQLAFQMSPFQQIQHSAAWQKIDWKLFVVYCVLQGCAKKKCERLRGEKTVTFFVKYCIVLERICVSMCGTARRAKETFGLKLCGKSVRRRFQSWRNETIPFEALSRPTQCKSKPGLPSVIPPL